MVEFSYVDDSESWGRGLTVVLGAASINGLGAGGTIYGLQGYPWLTLEAVWLYSTIRTLGARTSDEMDSDSAPRSGICLSVCLSEVTPS
jgi:hypothetical protein